MDLAFLKRVRIIKTRTNSRIFTHTWGTNMTIREKRSYSSFFPDFAAKMAAELMQQAPQPQVGDGFDPELLYVECQTCGKPVLWEQGKTTALLFAAGVDTTKLDERCLILSEGCPACAPQEKKGYTLAVVRIAGLTPEEAVYMARPGGTA